jgi:hypothetical protein
MFGDKYEIQSRIITKSYGLGSRGIRVQFPAEARQFSLLQRFQTGCAPQPTSYSMATEGGKAAGT